LFVYGLGFTVAVAAAPLRVRVAVIALTQLANVAAENGALELANAAVIRADALVDRAVADVGAVDVDLRVKTIVASGKASEATGNTAAALSLYASALGYADSDAAALIGMARVNFGLCLSGSGDTGAAFLERAETCLMKVLRRDSTVAVAWYSLLSFSWRHSLSACLHVVSQVHARCGLA
jgi:hypothetical protein